MREIQDKALLDSYLRRFCIDSFFDTPDLPFRLYEYEVGELMNVLHPSGEYLKFLVEGAVTIYGVRPDGRREFLQKGGNCFEVLGDMEFCGYHEEAHLQEVTVQVRTVELPLLRVREQLWQDNRFLLHLIQTVGRKMSATSAFRALVRGDCLEELLVNYLRYECPDHRITSVEDTAFRLNYSRAHLQRVLRELTQTGVLKKQGKGTYHLIK